VALSIDMCCPRPSSAVNQLKFEIHFFVTVKTPILHHRTKFRKERSNRCGDIAIFLIFKTAATEILTVSLP